jgi:hypothetical protein
VNRLTILAALPSDIGGLADPQVKTLSERFCGRVRRSKAEWMNRNKRGSEEVFRLALPKSQG